MRRERKTNLKFLLRTALFLTPVIALSLALALFFAGSDTAMADSSMEINGNGVLVRYNIMDGATQVSIPGNVKAIGDRVFMGDKSLERINIPGSVKVIGEKAFYGCDHLLEINLREGTETIKDSAFAMCTGLGRAQLPSTLRDLGNGVFAGDTALNQVSIAEGNRKFFINDNVIYNYDSTRLIEMVPGRQGENFDMPFSVKSIAPYAFWGAGNLKNVRVSNNVNSITPFAFTNASAMEFIYLPNSVSSIQEYAFRNCSKLRTVAAEGSIAYIDDSAFSGVDPEMVSESNVSFSEASEDHVKNEAGPGKKPEKEQDIDGAEAEVEADNKAETDTSGSTGQVSSGGEIVFGTPWGTRAPYRETDLSDPGLYGAGRIVGGKTIIIPAEKQDYSRIPLR